MSAEDQSSVDYEPFKIFTDLLKKIDDYDEFEKALLEINNLSENDLIEIKIYCKAYIYTFLDDENTLDESSDIDEETKEKIRAAARRPASSDLNLDGEQLEQYLKSYKEKNPQPPRNLSTNISVQDQVDTNQVDFAERQQTFVINRIYIILNKVLKIIDSIDSLLKKKPSSQTSLMTQTSPVTQATPTSPAQKEYLKEITNTYLNPISQRRMTQTVSGGSKKRTKRKRNNKKSKKRKRNNKKSKKRKRKRKTLRRRQRS